MDSIWVYYNDETKSGHWKSCALKNQWSSFSCQYSNMYDTLFSYNKKERIYNEMASMHVKIYKTAPLQKETVRQLYPDKTGANCLQRQEKSQ